MKVSKIDTFFLFNSCTSLRTLDLSSFDTSNIIVKENEYYGYSFMFVNCSSLETVYVSELWQVPSSLSSQITFNGCSTNLKGQNGIKQIDSQSELYAALLNEMEQLEADRKAKANDAANNTTETTTETTTDANQ